MARRSDDDCGREGGVGTRGILAERVRTAHLVVIRRVGGEPRQRHGVARHRCGVRNVAAVRGRGSVIDLAARAVVRRPGDDRGARADARCLHVRDLQRRRRGVDGCNCRVHPLLTQSGVAGGRWVDAVRADEALVGVEECPEVRTADDLRERGVERVELLVELRGVGQDLRGASPGDLWDDRGLAARDDRLDHAGVVVVEDRRAHSCVAAEPRVVRAVRDGHIRARKEREPGIDAGGSVVAQGPPDRSGLLSRKVTGHAGADLLSKRAAMVFMVHRTFGDRVAVEDPIVPVTGARVVDVHVQHDPGRIRVEAVSRGHVDPDPVVSGEIDRMLPGVIVVPGHRGEGDPSRIGQGPAGSRIRFERVIPRDVVRLPAAALGVDARPGRVVVDERGRIVVPNDENGAALRRRDGREVVREIDWRARGWRAARSPAVVVDVVVRPARGYRPAAIIVGESRQALADEGHGGRHRTRCRSLRRGDRCHRGVGRSAQGSGRTERNAYDQGRYGANFQKHRPSPAIDRRTAHSAPGPLRPPAGFA